MLTKKERYQVGLAVIAAREKGEDQVTAAAVRAVELVEARGGTMTADNLRHYLQHRPELSEHISALGARNAVLEGLNKAAGEELSRLKREVERLEAERDEAEHLGWVVVEERDEARQQRDTLSQRLTETNQRAQQNWEKQEAERERLQGERDAALKRAEAAEARVRQLAIAGAVLTGVLLAAVDKHIGEPNPSTSSNGSATPDHHELVKVRGETFDSASRAYNAGAESMRAACCEAVVSRLLRHWLQNLREDVKAAIEGTAP